MNTTCCTTPSGTPATKARRYRRPVYTVREEPENFVVEVHLPGVKKEHLSLCLEKDQLDIVAPTEGGTPKQWKLLRRESLQADFRLSLTLNVAVQEQAINATLENGILTLTLPKAEELKPRKIDIH